MNGSNANPNARFPRTQRGKTKPETNQYIEMKDDVPEAFGRLL